MTLEGRHHDSFITWRLRLRERRWLPPGSLSKLEMDPSLSDSSGEGS